MAKKAKKQRHIVLVLDETGSMTRNWHETMDAVNEYFSGLKKEKGTLATVLKFSTDYKGGVKTLVDAVPIEDVPKLTANNYVPSGMTPLHDAVAHGILHAKQLDTKQVLVTIYTDGLENQSKEYGLADVKKLVEETKDKITYTFLGADINAYQEGAKYGFAAGATIQGSGQTVKSTMDAHLAATQRWVAGGATGQSVSDSFYSDEDKSKAETK